MSFCFDCGKTNKDESLNQIRQLAKQIAIEKNETQVIYKEGNEYQIISASTALAGGYPIIEFVSQYN